MKNFLPKSSTNPKGFTLIELMVVISIIAFLAVIGIAAYSNAQKTARDGRRKADIDAISQAMETKYDVVAGTYPSTAFSQGNSGGYFSSGQIPVDPSSPSSTCGSAGAIACFYTVKQQNSNKGFSACAALENGTGNATSDGASAYPTYPGTNSNFYYCKSSQQSQ